MDTKNSSFLLRFLFDMFWLFFGHSPSVSSLFFVIKPFDPHHREEEPPAASPSSKKPCHNRACKSFSLIFYY